MASVKPAPQPPKVPSKEEIRKILKKVLLMRLNLKGFLKMPSKMLHQSTGELLSMGDAVSAECKCGYNRLFFIGCGMMDFTKPTYYFPCLCETCGEIVEANVLSHHLKCPSCKATELIPYGDRRIIGKKGKKLLAICIEKEFGRALRITDGEYYCPKCGENNLKFRDGGVLGD